MKDIKKNCNTCKFSFLENCNGLKSNKEYQEIRSALVRHEYRESYTCTEYKCMYIQYPIEVSKINTNTDNKASYRNKDIGKFVKIRPCNEKYGNKTYLGLFLGEIPTNHYITHNPETLELSVAFRYDPAIFMFDLSRIVYGYESWWGIIESEEDLKEITDADINSVWYVKALKELSQNK